MMPDFSSTFLEGVTKAEAYQSFEPLLEALYKVLTAQGIQVDRLQLPLSFFTGFRHPTLWANVVTWRADNGFEDSFEVTHCDIARRLSSHSDGEEKSRNPFMHMTENNLKSVRRRLDETDELEFEVLRELRAAGFKDYFAFSIKIPGSDVPQGVSIASKVSFPSCLEETVEQLSAPFALALNGVYRMSQATELSRAYLGIRTGARVLSGEIVRGNTALIQSGIMFCDLRGFTALSETLGAQGIVRVINDVFDLIGQRASRHGGEILKFIGDAMLIVFPTTDGELAKTAQGMLDTVVGSTNDIEEYARESGQSVRVGFGCHIGEVVYGNIGTQTRLDFTVMGPAVNLASRLESLTKALNQTALFSDSFARHCRNLTYHSEQSVKGIEVPVKVFTIGA